MSNPLPAKADEILALRQKGKRPADMVLVSMIGWLGEKNPCVLAQPGLAYDWRFLADLDAMLVVSSTTDKAHVKAAVDSILLHKPRYLGVWIADKQNGFNVAWGSYRPKSKTVRMLALNDRKTLAGIGSKAIEKLNSTNEM